MRTNNCGQTFNRIPFWLFIFVGLCIWSSVNASETNEMITGWNIKDSDENTVFNQLRYFNLKTENGAFSILTLKDSNQNCLVIIKQPEGQCTDASSDVEPYIKKLTQIEKKNTTTSDWCKGTEQFNVKNGNEIVPVLVTNNNLEVKAFLAKSGDKNNINLIDIKKELINCKDTSIEDASAGKKGGGSSPIMAPIVIPEETITAINKLGTVVEKLEKDLSGILTAITKNDEYIKVELIILALFVFNIIVTFV